MSNVLILDAEIKKAILGRNDAPIDGIEYCAGWRDFKNMGVSCLGGWQSWDDRVRVFDEYGAGEIDAAVAKSDYVVTFNGHAFDGPLLAEHGIEIPAAKHVDLLVEIWRAHGLGPTFEYPSHAGFSLDACAKANGLPGKSGTGALAPVMWQRGQYCAVIDYCVMDILQTRELIYRALTKQLVSPVEQAVIGIALPFERMNELEREKYSLGLRTVQEIEDILTREGTANVSLAPTGEVRVK